MRYKILLVDDSQDLLDAYVVFLKIRTSHEVRTAASGRSALEIIRTWRPDLVVTDILMPDMSGRETAERVTSIRPMPILYMSGYAEPVLASRGTLGTSVLLVHKPFTEETLLAKISEALHQG